MAINPDIRDQAYQFFVEEARDLLDRIEAGLLNLNHDRSPAIIHSLMRSAHSLKGGAAGVGLDPIATIAHRLENIFKALYNEALAADPTLENWLLPAYDCLRLPLMEQIVFGYFDAGQALTAADSVFGQIEAYCGDALTQAESYIPSSAEMGIDMVASIFEVDVAQGLAQIETALAQGDPASELQIQTEVFAGFAEILNLPDFGRLAQTIQQALILHPDRATAIAQLALIELEQSRQAVLAGDRRGGSAPSAALLRFTAAEIELDDVQYGLDAAEINQSNLETPAEFADLSLEEVGLPELSINLEATFIEGLLDDTTVGLEYDELLSELEDLTDSSPKSSTYESEIVTDQVIDDTTLGIEADEFEPEFIDSADCIPELVVNQAETFVEAWGSEQTPEAASVSFRPSSPNINRELSPIPPRNAAPTAHLTVRVDAERLEYMNNLVGELAINRSSLSLQNDQLHRVIRVLRSRFERFQRMVTQLQSLSDQINRLNQILVTPDSDPAAVFPQSQTSEPPFQTASIDATSIEFDVLEMDRYGTTHMQLQTLLEDLVQLEESVDDVTLFARQSNHTLEQQQYRLTQLRDELIWARMLPLSEVLNRFPRILRDLSVTYQKLVQLKLTGAEVLVDRAILEKLSDPLLHLLRNAFDHGIESPAVRQQSGKPAQGQIEIRAFHQGNQTVIEVRDDGGGVDLDRIRTQVQELNWLSAAQVASLSEAQLIEFIFEPGFSTATQISELSGRGFGLDVVRSQLQALRSTVQVTSKSGQGTTFTLTLPLTLTITQLIVCLVGSLPIALPTDSIEDILIPQPDQLQNVGTQQLLNWRGQQIPVYSCAEFLKYTCPVPSSVTNQILETFPAPQEWKSPIVVLQHEQQQFGFAVERIMTEQELVIKPFGSAIASPGYLYGCTILGDGSPVPVVDAAALLSWTLAQSTEAQQIEDELQPAPIQAPTILVVDDAIMLRRTLALFLEREGFRVLQAQDGQEAIKQLQQSAVQLVICDIEMPNMNGFEFLNARRQNTQFANIPVMMLTSRSNEKHRWLALQLGATAYFTKPYLEQEFLAAIQTTLMNPSVQADQGGSEKVRSKQV